MVDENNSCFIFELGYTLNHYDPVLNNKQTLNGFELCTLLLVAHVLWISEEITCLCRYSAPIVLVKQHTKFELVLLISYYYHFRLF